MLVGSRVVAVASQVLQLVASQKSQGRDISSMALDTFYRCLTFTTMLAAAFTRYNPMLLPGKKAHPQTLSWLKWYIRSGLVEDALTAMAALGSDADKGKLKIGYNVETWLEPISQDNIMAVWEEAYPQVSSCTVITQVYNQPHAPITRF